MSAKNEKSRSPFGARPSRPRTVTVSSFAADRYRGASWVSNPRGQPSAPRGGDAMRVLLV
jgi:hypothetical protein